MIALYSFCGVIYFFQILSRLCGTVKKKNEDLVYDYSKKIIHQFLYEPHYLED